MFLSIVIPIYNAERTIKRCLDSIWSQGLPDDDFEVICVDDCSSDKSVEILSEIAKDRPQLRVLRNAENLRAGGARNHGVREAKGEYIVFIDADDYFHNGSLREAYNYQTNNRLDILMCDFARQKENEPNNIMVHNFKSKKIMSGREFMIVNSLPYAPWKYIFRRSLMIDNNIFFAEKVSCEDVDWSHKIAFFVGKMQYQPILLTHYNLLESSQTGSEYKNPQTVFYRLMAGKRVAELISLCNTSEEKQHILRVAQETLNNGIIFLCATMSNPIKKAKMIIECIDKDINWTGNLSVIRKYPLLYSIFSSIVAPVFRSAIYLKRNLFGR